jgi:hypothetical protein
MRASWLLGGLLVLACGSSPREGFGGGDPGQGPPGAPGGDPGNLGPGTTPGTTGCVGSAPLAKAQDITIDPAYAADYHAYDLGPVPGMPAYKYGGIHLLAGDDNTLLVGGNANEQSGGIWSIKVTRGVCHHITGWGGTATHHAYAPHIDGGLVYGPGGALMYAGWPANTIGVLAPGAKNPARIIEAYWLGIPEAMAALAFVPPGFPGEGKLKLVTWEAGWWFDATVTMDGAGLPNVTAATELVKLPGGPEGFAYIPKGSPKFDVPSMVVSEWSANGVAAYDVGPSGDPVLGSRRDLLKGLSGAEGAFFDPLTGDFVFSTWNLSRPERVVLVTGFAPIKSPQ